MQIEGMLLLREIPPEWSQQEYAFWWLPEIDEHTGRILRVPRMSMREKDRYTVYQTKNVLTLAGRSQLLNYIGNASSTPFGKIFSVGIFPLTSVSAGDTIVSSEIGRVVPGTPIITGTQVDIPCSFGSNQFAGQWTNVGLYGTSSATTTLGTGTLFTHALFNYNKVNGTPVVVDYLINLT